MSASTQPAAETNGEPPKFDLNRLYQELACSPEGLDAAEAKKRLEQYGPNALEEKKQSALLKFLGYFWGPIPWMIEVAAVLSAIVGHWVDLIIISVLLLFNAVVGFWQEHQAANAVDALKKQLALKARVKRDGQWAEIDSVNLVPGDIVRLRLGDIIPADVRLTEGDYLSVDQSALTGESLPVDKNVGDIAYSSSIAKQGEMVALVTATGANTFFGKTAKLVSSAKSVSHFQKAVLTIGDYLIYLSLGLAAILILTMLFRGEPVLTLFQFALILVVAAIPVAMPAVLSVTMAIGAVVLARKKAILTKLESIEEMAGMDILCSDKTGTLTQNKLTLGEPALFGAKDGQALILAGALASKAEDRDAIDLAVLNGLKDPAALKAFKQTKFVPFDPVHKRTEAEVQDSGGKSFKVTKGAPQIILDMCKPPEDLAKAVDAKVNEFALKGFRTLGVARLEGTGAWQFLGLLPLFDPPREDAANTIREANEHGIHVKMVTGDNTAIAKQIAGQLGLGTKIHTADEFFKGTSEDDDHFSESGRRRGSDRGFRPGVSRTQIPDRQGAAKPGPHRGHDRRRRERRAGAQAGQLRHRGQRRDRRGSRCGRAGAHRAGPFRDRAGRGNGAEDFRAHEQLRDLSHHRNHPHHVLRGGGDDRLQVLSHHHRDDHPAGAAERSAHSDHRLRQHLA